MKVDEVKQLTKKPLEEFAGMGDDRHTMAESKEVIALDLRAKWLRPRQRGKDPIDALIGII